MVRRHVNFATHLAVFFVGDDMLDLDEGYTGVVQFAFGIQPFFNNNDGTAWGSASGDKIGENDGDDMFPDNALVQQQRVHPPGDRQHDDRFDSLAALQSDRVQLHGDRHHSHDPA